MNLDEAIKGIPVLIEKLKEEIKLETETVAINAIATIKDRVVQEGLDSNNQAWRPYDEKYKAYRVKKGRQVAHVDFSLTGDMWNSVGIVESVINDKEATVTVKGRDQITNDKLAGNSNSRGAILKLTKEEEKITQEDFGADMEDRIKFLMKNYL